MKIRSALTGLLTGLLIAVLPGNLAAQAKWAETPRPGIAVEDVASASLVNLAAVGVGDASGIGWSGYLDGSGDIDQTVHATMGWFTYNFRLFNGRNNHEIGVGFPLYDGVYLGSSFRWSPDETLGYNIHMLYRPTDWLSLGFKGESLNDNPWFDWGVGLRPLVLSGYWNDRLTLFYDARINQFGTYKNLTTGLKLAPVDGLEVYGHWDFRSEKFVTGINLSWHNFLVGGDAAVAGNRSWEEGSIQAFASVKQMRSLASGNRVLVVYDVAQVITDTPRPFAAAQDFGPDPVPVRSIYEFLRDMEDIIASPEVDAILFDSQALWTSFSNIIEIEQVLTRLKESGKKIYFYAELLGSTQYALAASVGDGIFMSPQGSLDLTGFGVTNLYFKDILAKYGVKIHNFRSHDYKTAFDSLSESSMSDAQRESLEFVYGGLQDELDRMIGGGRKDRIRGDLESLFAEGFWMSAARAREAGLIDDVMYRDQLDDWVDRNRFQVRRFSATTWEIDYGWDASNRPNVAVIYANGVIAPGEGIAGQTIGSESLARAIRDARSNPMVQAIVLRVNSGGGSALASDIVAREVALCRTGPKTKPVVVSMAGVAASGGYMIAAPGAKITATPATITGSIGVITIIPDVSGFLEMFQIGEDTVVTTESADAPNIFRPLTEAEERKIRQSVADNYDHFISLVAVNREMTEENVNQVAMGRIWTGRQAMERGLVDDMGGLSDAIVMAEEMAGVKNARILEVNPGSPIFAMPGMPPFLAALLGIEAPDPLAAVPEDLRDIVEFYRTLSVFESGEALYLMPYTQKDLNLDGGR